MYLHAIAPIDAYLSQLLLYTRLASFISQYILIKQYTHSFLFSLLLKLILTNKYITLMIFLKLLSSY